MEQTRGWTHSSLCRIRSSGGISTWTTWSLRWPRSPKRRLWENLKGRCKNDSWAWAWGKLWRAQTSCVNVCYCADGLYRSRIFPGMLFSVRYNPIFSRSWEGALGVISLSSSKEQICRSGIYIFLKAMWAFYFDNCMWCWYCFIGRSESCIVKKKKRWLTS